MKTQKMVIIVTQKSDDKGMKEITREVIGDDLMFVELEHVLRTVDNIIHNVDVKKYSL